MGIRATFSLTYGSLSEPTRRLLAQLSLIDAPDFASWVSAALLDMDPECAGDLLDALVQAHLVEPQPGEQGETRFRMHDLVRIYARERLAAEIPTADRAGALQRLLGCWLSLAREAHRRASGGDFGILHGRATVFRLPEELVTGLLSKPLEWFRTERTGLVSAIMQAGRAGLDELCWDLAVTSVTLFELENQAEDWRKTHEVALEVTRRVGNERGEAAILYSLGNLEIGLNTSEAARYVEAALGIFDKLGEVHGRGLALSALASIDRICGRYSAAAERYQEALLGLRQAGDKTCEIDVLANMAQIEMEREDFAQAEKLLDQALLICREIKAWRATAQAEYRLGEFYLCRKELDRAERSFSAVLRTVQQEGDLVGQAFALAGLAATRTEQGQHSSAEADLAVALDLSRQLNDNLIHVRVLLSGVELYLAEQKPDRASALLNEALFVSSDIGPASVWHVRLLELKARISDQSDRAGVAAAARKEAISLAGDVDPVLAGVWSRRLARPPTHVVGDGGFRDDVGLLLQS